MNTITSDLLKEKLAAAIRDTLARGEEVVLPDFGVFRIENKPSEASEDEHGQVVMHPPRDVVVFYPEDF